MIRSLALRALLALPAIALSTAALPAQAQGTTHLNVPAKQMVWMSYATPAAQVGWDVIVDGVQTIYPNMTYTVPKGFSLVITDADLYLWPTNGVALSTYGSAMNVVIASPTSTDGAAIIVPFGYIPTYGVWTQVHLTAGTRIPSGDILKPWFTYGLGDSVPTAPGYQLTLHGYYVAE